MPRCEHCHSTHDRADVLCGSCRKWRDSEDALTPAERQARDAAVDADVDDFIAASDEFNRTVAADEIGDIGQLGRRRTALRAAEREASRLLMSAVERAVRAGMSESDAARLAGVDRMTVRKILGKR